MRRLSHRSLRGVVALSLGALALAPGAAPGAAPTARSWVQQPPTRRAPVRRPVVVQRRDSVAVPDVVGQNETVAKIRLDSIGLDPVVVDTTLADIRPGLVVAQSPGARTKVPLKARVTLKVARRPPERVLVAVPHVVGQYMPAATLALVGRRLEPAYERLPLRDLRHAVVAAQDPPADSLVPQGSRVRLRLRVIRDTVVPDVMGLDRAAAERTLLGSTLVLGAEGSAYNESVHLGLVTAQDPKPGTRVPLRSPVSVTLSLGPQPAEPRVSVPALAGLTRGEAEATLGAVRLVLGGVATAATDDERHVNRVMQQTHPPGDSVPPGTLVGIVLGLEPGRPVQTTISVPDVRGRTRDEAAALLADSGLRLGRVTVSGNGTPDRVAEQWPLPETPAAPNDMVNVRIAIAPPGTVDPGIQVPTPPGTPTVAPGVTPTVTPTVTRSDVVLVPALVGLDPDGAGAAVAAADLRLAVGMRRTRMRLDETVTSQLPAAGTAVARGSVVSVDLDSPPPWLPLVSGGVALLAVAGALGWNVHRIRGKPAATGEVTAQLVEGTAAAPPVLEPATAGEETLVHAELTFITESTADAPLLEADAGTLVVGEEVQR